VFPAKAWFRHTPWEELIKTVLRLERTVCRRDPATGLCKQTSEIVFWVSSAAGPTPEHWNEWIRAHWRIENGSHYVRDMTFAEDASRIRKNPDIVARLLLRIHSAPRRWERQHQKRPMANRPRHQLHPRNPKTVLRTEQPCQQ
jgi:hypothetical protein